MEHVTIKDPDSDAFDSAQIKTNAFFNIGTQFQKCQGNKFCFQKWGWGLKSASSSKSVKTQIS